MAESDPTHPSAERLRAFSSGAVEDEELDRIAAHLNECAACGSLVDASFAANALLKQLQSAARPGGRVQEDPAQRRRAARALQRGRFREPQSGGEAPQPPSDPDRTPHNRLTPADDEEQADDAPGESSFPRQVGDYDLLGEVGRGGMGVVYKARHRKLRRLVALKMVRSGACPSSTQRGRFLLEAELAARVQHPNIVQLYEVGIHEGLTFLTMEWVEGGALADRLNGRPWPPAAAARLVETLAWGTHAAHCQGVVHRDLKPGNILLAAYPGASDLIPKIADFSLARNLQAGTDLKTAGFVAGTPEYMAPEQATGHDLPPGPAVDVYALGVVLYELLTGQVPFQAKSAREILRAVSFSEPTPPRRVRPRVPRDLEAIVLKCLEKRPSRRYATAQELANDLERFRQGRSIAARPVGLATRVARWCGRNPTAAALLAALVAVIVAALILVTDKWQQPQERTHGKVQAGESYPTGPRPRNAPLAAAVRGRSSVRLFAPRENPDGLRAGPPFCLRGS